MAFDYISEIVKKYEEQYEAFRASEKAVLIPRNR